MKVTVPDHVRSELTRRWNEPHRRHHNQQHLDEVLAALDTLRDAFSTRTPTEKK